jgi:hypothetical protein
MTMSHIKIMSRFQQLCLRPFLIYYVEEIRQGKILALFLLDWDHNFSQAVEVKFEKSLGRYAVANR